MSNIDKINSIPITDVLNALGIKRKRKGPTLLLYEGGVLTDGWRASEAKGMVTDFSEKGRASGDRLAFVQAFLSVDKAGAFKWFESVFNLPSIEKQERHMEQNYVDAKKIREELEGINEEQSVYLMNRFINPELLPELRNYKGHISLPIRSLDGHIKSIQSRNVSEGGSRYYVLGNSDSDGIFYSNLDESKKAIIVVEGFTDYLTLKQYTTNVVGLVNAKNREQISYIKQLSKKWKIYLVPDCDEAGKSVVDAFHTAGIKAHIFSLEKYGVKDINQYVTSYNIDSDIVLKTIFSEALGPRTNLSIALSRAKEIRSKGIISIDNGGILDRMIGGLQRGSTTLINGPSGQGKTTLSLHMMMCLIKNNPELRIVYYSLETDVGRQVMKIIAYLAGCSEADVFRNIDAYSSYIEQLGQLEVYDNFRNMEDIHAHIRDNDVDVAIIDFAQKVRIDGVTDETARMIKYAQQTQDFAIDNGNVAIISLSQTSGANFQTPLLERLPKNSVSLFESSDTTINVGKDLNGKWCVAFLKTKNIGAEGWYKVCDTSYDYRTGEYIIFPPDELNETAQIISKPKKKI